jgi:hypothetical protein
LPFKRALWERNRTIGGSLLWEYSSYLEEFIGNSEASSKKLSILEIFVFESVGWIDQSDNLTTSLLI